MNGRAEIFITTVWQILSESAPWVIASLLLAGLVLTYLPGTGIRRRLNRPGLGGMAAAVGLGAVLPICSCGVIPLAVSLYRAGVRLGPVMAFTAATPIINPAAVLLSFALLGPQLTAAYIALGLLLPFVAGWIAERWGEGASERSASPINVPATVSAQGCCETHDPSPNTRRRGMEVLRQGFVEIGPTIAFYMAIGLLIAGVIAVFIPQAWTETFLRDHATTALLVAALLGASIYVCAVAHIPMVAALLAGGVAPGVAVVFLVTGTATNLPELVALYKTIGRRIVLIYTATLTCASLVAGALINGWLLPGFEPVFDPLESLTFMELGERFQPTFGAAFTLASSAVLVGLMVWGGYRHLARWRVRRRLRGGHEGCCSG